MRAGRWFRVVAALVGVGWLAVIVISITRDQPPPPGAADAQTLRAVVEAAILAGDDVALQNALPAGEIGQEYATEFLGRLPDHTALLARLDHQEGTDVITVSGGGPQGACVHWGVVVIDDRHYLDPVPLTAVCRP